MADIRPKIEPARLYRTESILSFDGVQELLGVFDVPMCDRPEVRVVRQTNEACQSFLQRKALGQGHVISRGIQPQPFKQLLHGLHVWVVLVGVG